MILNMLSSWKMVFHVWVLPAVILGGTYILAYLTRWVIRIIARNKRFLALQRLTGSLSSLVYLLGFRLFGELAPLPPKILHWFESAVFIFGVLVVMSLARKGTTIGIEWSAHRSPESKILQEGFIPLIKNLITLFVLMSGIITILKHFHYDVVSLLTALGIGSLAIGLAAKETFSNMISGFTLIIDRNLAPGDRINLSGTVGEVEQIGLRSTRIRTGNGSTLIVPNADMVNTKILNLSRPTRAIITTISFRVPMTVPLVRIKPLVFSVLQQTERVLHENSKTVHISSWADSSQQISVSFWISDLDVEAIVVSEFHEKLLAKFLQEGISLSSPTSQPIN